MSHLTCPTPCVPCALPSCLTHHVPHALLSHLTHHIPHALPIVSHPAHGMPPCDPMQCFYHIQLPPGPLCMCSAPPHEPPRLSHAIPTPYTSSLTLIRWAGYICFTYCWQFMYYWRGDENTEGDMIWIRYVLSTRNC